MGLVGTKENLRPCSWNKILGRWYYKRRHQTKEGRYESDNQDEAHVAKFVCCKGGKEGALSPAIEGRW